MRFTYPATLTAEPEGGFTVTFDDVPGAITHGADRATALARAAEALVSVLAVMADDGEARPSPSPARGRPLVSVTALEAAKLALNDAMGERRISNVALAAAMECDEKVVRRLRDVLHVSRIADVERALGCLGKRLTVEVADAG